MVAYYIVTLSIIFQIAAAILALRLIKVVGRHIAWILIASAMSLQVVRRLITLKELFAGEVIPYHVFGNEVVGLVLSILMVLGVLLIGPFFNRMVKNGVERRSAEGLKKINEELAVRVKERTVELTKALEKLEIKSWGLDKANEGIRILYKDLENVNKELKKDITERKHIEDELRNSYDLQHLINALLFLSLEKISLEELLDHALDLVFKAPWLSLEAKGAIFLTGEDGKVLVMKAQKGLSEQLHKFCAQVPIGKCYCGKAAEEKKVQFSNQLDAYHEIRDEEMDSHGHYCVPIISRGRVLGVLNTYLKEGYSHRESDEVFLVSISNVLAGIIERRQAEEKTEELLEELRVVVETVADGITLSDSQGKFLIFNQKIKQITGYTIEEANNSGDFTTFIYPDLKERQAALERLEGVIKGNVPYSLEEETIIQAKDGIKRTLMVSTIFLDFKSGRMFLTVYHDITERKVAEKILKRDKDMLEGIVSERTRELVRTQKELENTKRLSDIGTLAATIAHELRNPLGVIKTAAYNIKRKKKGIELDSHLINIDKKILESEQIIRNLLSYSRIKMPRYENVAVVDILNNCISNLQDKYVKWAVEVNTTVNSKSEVIIEADSLHMMELFYNILDNAYQSFPDKKGKIEIDLIYDEQENKLCIRFTDNGIGIEEKDLQKIFEPFFTNKARGIGLGLTVCRQVVSLCGGKIDIQSQGGKGTTVLVSLPIKHG